MQGLVNAQNVVVRSTAQNWRTNDHVGGLFLFQSENYYTVLVNAVLIGSFAWLGEVVRFDKMYYEISVYS